MAEVIERECQHCKSQVSEFDWPKYRVYAKIDRSSTALTCGVTGLIEMANIQVGSGIVKCAVCGSEIYREKD